MPTVLLVEDNLDDERLVRRTLEKNNVTNEVVVAITGQGALDALQEMERLGQRPDLVILDVKLPDMSGLQVLKDLRENPRTQLVPVVVLTGNASPDDVAAAYRIGANSVVLKPADFAEFSEALLHLTIYWLLVNRSTDMVTA